MRHPSEQHRNRLEEVARVIAYAHCEIMGERNHQAHHQKEANDHSLRAVAAEERLDELLKLQTEILSNERLCWNGLPVSVPRDHFMKLTERDPGPPTTEEPR